MVAESIISQESLCCVCLRACERKCAGGLTCTLQGRRDLKRETEEVAIYMWLSVVPARVRVCGTGKLCANFHRPKPSNVRIGDGKERHMSESLTVRLRQKSRMLRQRQHYQTFRIQTVLLHPWWEPYQPFLLLLRHQNRFQES